MFRLSPYKQSIIKPARPPLQLIMWLSMENLILGRLILNGLFPTHLSTGMVTSIKVFWLITFQLQPLTCHLLQLGHTMYNCMQKLMKVFRQIWKLPIPRQVFSESSDSIILLSRSFENYKRAHLWQAVNLLPRTNGSIFNQLQLSKHQRATMSWQ